MESAVIIFSKAPIPGLVKTRLTQGSSLSEKDVALIADAMLKDTISLTSKSHVDKILIGYHPEEAFDIIRRIVESVRKDGFLNKKIEYLKQVGSNFDQRFGSIVKEAFKLNLNYLIVLGADLPYLDPLIINNTLKELITKDKDNLLVLGPSSGGGIYLVGLTNEFDSNWFSEYQLFRGGIELSQFIKFCKKKKFKLKLLPPYGDIDIEEDLVSLILYIEAISASEINFGFHYPYYTAQIIDDLGLSIIKFDGQTRKRKIGKLK